MSMVLLQRLATPCLLSDIIPMFSDEVGSHTQLMIGEFVNGTCVGFNVLYLMWPHHV